MQEDAVFADLRAAGEALERAQTLPPGQLTNEAETATRAIARARDLLIVRVREAGEGARGTPDRLLLDAVNAVLSQAIAIQFPAAGVNRKHIEATRDALANILRAQRSRSVS